MSVDGPGTAADQSYAFDANGNRVSGGSVIGDGNRLLSDNRFELEYDREGNVLRRTNRLTGERLDFVYDHRNRLVRVESWDAANQLTRTVEHVYDVFDRRIAVIEDGVRTSTVYDGDNAWADFDGQGALQTQYWFGPGPDNLLARWRPTEDVAWYLKDNLGSTRDLLSGTGEVIASIDYDAYGAVQSETGGEALDRYRFTGSRMRCQRVDI